MWVVFFYLKLMLFEVFQIVVVLFCFVLFFLVIFITDDFI